MQRGLHDASVDVIYRQFVDARVAAAESPTPAFDDREQEPEPEPQQIDVDDDDDNDSDDGDYDDVEMIGQEDGQLPIMLTPADERWVKVRCNSMAATLVGLTDDAARLHLELNVMMWHVALVSFVLMARSGLSLWRLAARMPQ